MKILSCIGFAALAAISFGANPVGYLAKIGPAPLRFQAPAKGPEATVALPPLAKSDPPPAPHDEVITNETATIEAPAQPPQSVVVEAAPAPKPVEPAFTPQMLLQFFNHNATNQEPSVITPF